MLTWTELHWIRNSYFALTVPLFVCLFVLIREIAVLRYQLALGTWFKSLANGD